MESIIKNISLKIDEFKKQFEYEIYLSQIKFYFDKNDNFYSIIFIFQNDENFKSSEPSSFIFTNPKILGIENLDSNLEEAILNFDKKDEMITKMEIIIKNNIVKGIFIKTSYGKFLEIGIKEEKDIVFSKTFFPPLFFNGFNIQYNNKSIIDININSILNDKIKIENKKPELIDISNKYFENDFISPIFQSDIIGNENENIEYSNDIQKFHYIQEMKDNKIKISEIIIWINKKEITRFDIKYYNISDGKINIGSHISKNYKENNNKKYNIVLDNDDFICEIIIGLSKENKLKNLYFKSKKGKNLEIINEDCKKNIITFKANQTGKLFKLLYIILGIDKVIETIQFYYEYIVN